MNWNMLLFVQIQTLPPRLHHKWKEIIEVCKKPMKIIGDQLPTKSPRITLFSKISKWIYSPQL